jgi:(1->4)-alpha-D-glucan 1-alpha-D-glucosylmutase
MHRTRTTPPTPRPTYRIQFNAPFTFADATALVPYLAGVGIGDLYASPWLRARPGSLHGYDMIAEPGDRRRRGDGVF